MLPIATSAVLVVVHRPTLDAEGSGPQSSLVDASNPTVHAMDLGVTRGDGIFETVGIRHGRVQASDAHFARFENSARLLDLPRPDIDAYRDALQLGIDAMGDTTDAYAKYVLTRGREDDPAQPATGYVYFNTNDDHTAVRESGLRVITLSRGYSLDVASTSPWLLQGAKYLSYAVNRAVIREARRRSADDVLFTTTDGFVLEGPTSTLVLLRDGVFVTPDPEHGVLVGTTQCSVFDFAAAAGFPTQVADVSLPQLLDSSALWLTNSQRLAVPVTSIDGHPVATDPIMTERINAFLAARAV